MSIVLQPLNAQLLQNFDLSFDGLFPLGDKTPNLAWNSGLLPSLNSLPQNTPISFNARAALAGDAGAVLATTITVVFVSGTSSAGWVSPGAGNNCTNTGSAIGQGVFILRATYLTLIIDSPPLTWSIVAAASGGKFKFNPSIFYIYIDQNQSFSAQLARMKALKAANPLIRGFQVFWNWSHFENPALVGGAAQYDGSWGSQTNVDGMRGFKLWQTFLDACAAMGVQFDVHLYSYAGASAAGATSPNFPTSFAPAYLAGGPSSPYGPNTATTNGINGAVWINSYAGNTVGKAGYYRFWVQAVMARLIACAVAYGNQFDSHPNLECTSWLDESSIDGQTSYSDAGAASTMIGPGKFYQAIRAAWPTTQLRVWLNYLQSLGAIDQHLAAAFASKWTVGGPDTANETGSQARAITADWRYRGLAGTNGVVDSTVPDYRALGGSNHREVEPEDLAYDLTTNTTINNSRHIGDGVLAHIVAQANLMKATHMYWYDNGFTGPDRNRTKAFVSASHPSLLDFLNSASQGGNVAVNGVTAGISLTTTSRPAVLN